MGLISNAIDGGTRDEDKAAHESRMTAAQDSIFHPAPTPVCEHKWAVHPDACWAGYLVCTRCNSFKTAE